MNRTRVAGQVDFGWPTPSLFKSEANNSNTVKESNNTEEKEKERWKNIRSHRDKPFRDGDVTLAATDEK